MKNFFIFLLIMVFLFILYSIPRALDRESAWEKAREEEARELYATPYF